MEALNAIIAFAAIFIVSAIIEFCVDAKRAKEKNQQFANEIDTLRKQLQEQKNKNTQLNKTIKEQEEQRTKESALAFHKNREYMARIDRLERELLDYNKNLPKLLSSNLSSMPWLAGMMADYLTYELEVEAKKLEWGSNIQRQKKVASIRQLRAETKAAIEEAKIASYQLEYLKTLFPVIDEIIETEYADLHINATALEGDSTRQYLSTEEWHNLSVSERNQLALDRYISSHRKTKWQIGRDYENAVAYEYRQKGYSVDNCGSYLGLSDMGRDIIAKKDNTTIIIQCKYWSKEKTIHEKHIFQLYGTLISYCIENKLTLDSVYGVFVTNTKLSDVAKNAAELLNVKVAENHPMTEYPRIKCNIGRDEFGNLAKIYHLPMDDQYDSAKIDKDGEFYAFTVEEAENAGFRRAYRWHSNDTAS